MHSLLMKDGPAFIAPMIACAIIAEVLDSADGAEAMKDCASLDELETRIGDEHWYLGRKFAFVACGSEAEAAPFIQGAREIVDYYLAEKYRQDQDEPRKSDRPISLAELKRYLRARPEIELVRNEGYGDRQVYTIVSRDGFEWNGLKDSGMHLWRAPDDYVFSEIGFKVRTPEGPVTYRYADVERAECEVCREGLTYDEQARGDTVCLDDATRSG